MDRAAEADWRRKYFDSVRAIEDEARLHRTRLQSLYRLVGRLCSAANGQSALLDQILKRLRDAVRREAGSDELDPLSEAIADTVRELDQGGTSDTGSTITRRIRAWIAPGSEIPEATPASAPAPTPEKVGGAQLCDVLLRLLSELRQEPGLAENLDAIDAEISTTLTPERLPGVIEKVGGLLIQRIRRLEKARRELETLLDQMVGQLDALTRYIAGHTEDESWRESSSRTLNMQVTNEMRALGESADSDTDLARLRQQLRTRLAAIGQHLAGFREREAERARESRDRTARMRARMQEMEGEARKLQARLSDEQRMALLDPLTRIGNRLAWERRLAEERDRWQRFGQPFCVAAWDIDGFKMVNDTYGHRAGDRVLTVIAETLASGVRGTDFVARYGGEEFVMLLPATALAEGLRIAESLRESIARLGFHFSGTPVSVTVSCGITALRDSDAPEETFDRADKALYQAKKSGRNRVIGV